MNRTHIGLGLFVIGTIGLLVWLAQSIGAIGSRGGHAYELRLAHAAGLVENNAVKIAGVSVGRIEQVAVDHDVAVLTLRIDSEIELHEDARAIVRAKSLLGEKYLQIDPGDRQAPVLADGAEIVHVDTPFEIDEVLNALEPILGGEDSIAAALAPLAMQLNDMLRDASGKDGKPPIITREEIDQIVDDVKATTASVRRMTEENEELVGEVLRNGNALLTDPHLKKILANTDRISTELDQRLPALLDKTESTMAKLEKLADIVDEPRRAKIGTIIDDASVATANLRQLSDDLKGIGKIVGPLTKDLALLAKRAAAIDGPMIRQFLQREGVKVYFGSKKKAEEALGSVPED
jgi:phospholipid/cholesterol/gamma-HCH transport system substrate-binding protein